MKIYFAASILGSQAHAVDYVGIVNLLKKYGSVLTEHVGGAAAAGKAEARLSYKEIHDRDMAWVLEADLLVAEISNPSLGVGYEIGRALEHGKRVLCVYHDSASRVSGMIQGNTDITVRVYKDLPELDVLLNKELI